MPKTLTATLDGITTIPRGTIATIKTYLACAVMPGSAQLPRGIALEPLKGPDEPRYHAIFTTLGTRWLWWSRLMLSPADRAAILDDPRVEACAIVQDGVDIGLLELDFRAETADLAFLGLFETATGKGLGRPLMSYAKARAAQQGATRLTVNTCTFDHPAALGVYRSAGFAVVSQAVELVPDPRLSGLLPTTAAPHIPLLS